jgi:hypothetical protein
VKSYLFLILTICLTSYSLASNLANPASPLPKANILVGASCHLGGYTLTNLDIAAIFNRFHGRIDFAPISFVSFGVDIGATQIDVDKYTTGTDTVGLFHGKYGFSGGAHLKMSSPFVKNMVSVFGIGSATYFSSENNNNAKYGGFDGAGVFGIQFRIPDFGFVSIGPMFYLIEGDATGADGKNEFYSNSNNIRGWISIDYHMKSNQLSNGSAYISLEFSASPKISYSSRIPIQEFSLSLSIGYISGKLYGDDKQPR